jgi:hypothetical protein
MRLISVGKNLAAGVETTVYKVPTGYRANWNLLYIHNSLGNNKTITVDWYDTSTATHVKILENYPFAANAYFQFSGQGSGVVLEEGDEVHMTTQDGSAFGVVCTFELSKNY